MNCLYCQSGLTGCILPQIGLDGFPACGEDFEAHVAARFGPFIVRLGQHRADQADDGVVAGKDPSHIGAADLLGQPFLGLLARICRQTSRGKPVKARMSSRAASRCAAAAGSLASLRYAFRKSGLRSTRVFAREQWPPSGQCG
jgi:hypothetical protein